MEPIDPKLINLAERVCGAICDEQRRGMKATSITINTDDWCALSLRGHTKQTFWSVPLEHRGTIPPGSFSLTSVGPG